MNKIAMFLYIIFYMVLIVPICFFCDMRKKTFPKFIDKIISKIEYKLGLF